MTSPIGRWLETMMPARCRRWAIRAACKAAKWATLNVKSARFSFDAQSS
jgi:hypothetical protein